MKKKTAALIGAIAGAPFGLVGAGVGSAIGAWLGEREDEDSSFQSNDEAAIVLAPAGVHLNESNMTIPWDKVYSVELDEDDDTVNVFFVGGLLVFSEDYDFEDGWDKFYPDATPEEDDMDEDALREAITDPNGINILKEEWERRLTSAQISVGAFEDASPEQTIYNCGTSVPTAIDFGKVYVDLSDGMKRQIANPEQVKAVLEYWLSIREGIEEKDKETRGQIKELKALIAELDMVVAPTGQTSAASSASEATPQGDYTREEALFLKRARRYATNDGEIDAKERADLEALAMKMGIDELRAEELIEEAFGQ